MITSTHTTVLSEAQKELVLEALNTFASLKKGQWTTDERRLYNRAHNCLVPKKKNTKALQALNERL